MSRIGKKPIVIPQGTEVTIDGQNVVVRGPLGELSMNVHNSVSIEKNENEVVLTPTNEEIQTIALWGTNASLVQNMVDGVNKAFEKKLILEGVGYRVEMQGTDLVLNVGFSHPVNVSVPEGLTVTVEKNTISISGISKHAVGQFAAKVRAIKKPEPYKGKGIRYDDEVIRRKEGKKAV